MMRDNTTCMILPHNIHKSPTPKIAAVFRVCATVFVSNCPCDLLLFLGLVWAASSWEGCLRIYKIIRFIDNHRDLYNFL